MRLCAIALLVACLGFTASAQSPASNPSQPTTLDVLLNEVRALRIALERTNQLGPKIQIALARMQFQEERVRGLTRQIESAHKDISDTQNHRGQVADNVKQVENRLNQASDPTTRKQLEFDIESMKAEMERMNTLEQQFRGREAELNVLLQNEQAKWSEINDQLISLEHALSAPTVGTPRP